MEAATASAALTMQEQTPNLWWPQDRAWCVATEIDLAWTYVGGPAGMIERLLGEARIEAVPAEPSDTVSRVEDWVTRWVDDAVDELLSDGETTITTSRGTLQAWLDRPTRLRTGVLSIASAGDNGVRSQGTQMISPDDEEAIRKQISFQVSMGVTDLVGGQ